MAATNSSSRLPLRLLALAIGCVVAVGLAWGWSYHRETQRLLEEAERRERLHALVDKHAREAVVKAPKTAVARTPESRDWYLSPEEAAKLFSGNESSETYDPWCYFRHVSNARVNVPWPEHPRGEWNFVTNSLGLREDAELSATKPDLRVLVAGDSHTEGYCENSESFPNLAQSALGRGRPASSVEVINAGNGGFSFYNYAGVLERFLDLSPDAFVLAVYSGNDFKELLLSHSWFTHTPLPERTPDAEEEVVRLRALSRPANGQCFLSLLWFRRHPETIEPTLAASVDLVSHIRRRCEENGIRFLCVLLPSAVDVPWGENTKLFESMRLAAGMTEEDLRVNDRMADDFLARIRQDGCDTLDTRASLRSQAQPCFWRKDMHLNVQGHAVVAEILAEKLASWGGRFGR